MRIRRPWEVSTPLIPSGSVGAGCHLDAAPCRTRSGSVRTRRGILADADLEAAVTRGVMHMYNNTGQSCNAPSRMLVPRDLLSEAETTATKVTGLMKRAAAVLAEVDGIIVAEFN